MAAAGSSGPARRHSRSDVVEAALRLLDREGLPNLSMRAIADELGVQVGALYWHVPNKQTLLAHVSERVLAHGAPDDGSRRDLIPIAVDFHERLLAYRDAAELVSSSLALGLIDPPARQLLVDAASRAGLDPRWAAVAASTITHYVIGSAFHEQQRLHADSAGVTPASAALSVADVGSRDDDFRAGLDLVVAGVHATAATPGPPVDAQEPSGSGATPSCRADCLAGLSATGSGFPATAHTAATRTCRSRPGSHSVADA